jgi:hypothetical protein
MMPVSGTRFRLFPQWQQGFDTPETVLVSSPAGSLRPGPEAPDMYALRPLAKTGPYDPPCDGPPYRGPVLPPVAPDASGHFDHIAPEDPAFLAVHHFGCVRRTLDVWEAYLGRQIIWWHAAVRPQLELVALVDWDNAQSGPGFIEMGMRPNLDGVMQLFALNFDVVAHETGHTILFSELGVPQDGNLHPQFLAFHESFSDLVALVAALHFPSVAQRLLAQTGGDLYRLNLISRIGEVSRLEQIRRADNTATMADMAGLRIGGDGIWIDPSGQGRNAHALAQPLTGALFDLLVEVCQDRLVASGALPRTADARRHDAAGPATQRAAARFPAAFQAALAHARDVLGGCMGHVMRTADPVTLSFDQVAGLVTEAAVAQGHGHQLADIVGLFIERGIDPRGTLRDRRRPGHARWRALPFVERARRMSALRGAGHGPLGCQCTPQSFLQAHAGLRQDHRAWDGGSLS